MKTIDLNCDMGEGMKYDDALVPYISSASIACGYHAGDTDTMQRTMELCLRNNIAIGAHPSFFDQENFGRTEMYLEPEALYKLVTEQLGLFASIAKEAGAVFHHVKPHGALYNMAAADEEMAATIALAVSEFDSSLLLYGLAGSHLLSAGKKAGLHTVSEAFADRTYMKDGKLNPRKQPDALIASGEEAAAQALQMVKENFVTTVNGNAFPIMVETLCIHGDNPNAVAVAAAVFSKLTENNFKIKAC